jgi:5-methylcytosine-specific restriction endonuclease McrA
VYAHETKGITQVPSSPATAHKRDDLRSNHWRRKVRPQVYALHGYVCHLCGLAIDPSIKSPHPQSPSVDHVIGAATGNDLRYLRPAHRICNLRKGDPNRTPKVKALDPQPKVMTQW